MNRVPEIRVVSGPDRGKNFRLDEELVTVGNAADCEIVLNDPQLTDQQLTIARKNNRFAIFTTLAGTIDVDGMPLPAEQWIWLPQIARIQITRQTVLVFENPQHPEKASGDKPAAASRTGMQAIPLPTTPIIAAANEATQNDLTAGMSSTVSLPDIGGLSTNSDIQFSKNDAGMGTASINDIDPTATVSTTKSGDKPRKTSRSKKTGATTVAKFITNREGEALVQLGADGNLPELNLQEDQQTKNRPTQKAASNPNVLYAVLACSFFASLMLLLMDATPSNVRRSTQEEARIQLRAYFNADEKAPKNYQLELREALLAHARGDRIDEKKHYRRILFMLNAQDVNPMNGLTGQGIASDDDLKALVIMLLE